VVWNSVTSSIKNKSSETFIFPSNRTEERNFESLWAAARGKGKEMSDNSYLLLVEGPFLSLKAGEGRKLSSLTNLFLLMEEEGDWLPYVFVNLHLALRQG
jgi:hypothetical protein